MQNEQEKKVIHRLILAREMGRQGYRWNRAYRRVLLQKILKNRKRSSTRIKRIVAQKRKPPGNDS